MIVTREFKFDAAHFLPDYKGDCSKLHGHTWRFAVGIEGEVDDKTNMVIDFKAIKAIVNKDILSVVDHALLNEVFSFVPTAENLVVWIYNTIEWELQKHDLPFKVRVKLWENYPECYVEYNGVDGG